MDETNGSGVVLRAVLAVVVLMGLLIWLDLDSVVAAHLVLQDQTDVRSDIGSLLQDQMTSAATSGLPNELASGWRLEEIEPVTTSSEYSCPVWCPTGDGRLALLGQDGTYVYSVGDRRLSRISAQVAGFKYRWTADGSALYYRTTLGDGLQALESIDTRSGSLSILRRGSDLKMPLEVFPGVYFSSGPKPAATKQADGALGGTPATAAFQEDDQIYVVQGGAIRQVTHGEGKHFLPQLSFDRRKVLYQELATGMFVLSLDSGETFPLGQGSDPVWCGNSEQIVFERARDNGHTITDSDLYLVTLAGALNQLTDTEDRIEMRPSCSSDGHFLAFDAGGAVYVGKLRKEQ